MSADHRAAGELEQRRDHRHRPTRPQQPRARSARRDRRRPNRPPRTTRSGWSRSAAGCTGLCPDHTQRQLYRITKAILDVVDWESYLEPNVDIIPYTALPFGARVVYFPALVTNAASTLRASSTPEDIPHGRRRLHPRTTRAARFRAVRAAVVAARPGATRKELTSLGITVNDWDGQSYLDATLGSSLTRVPR